MKYRLVLLTTLVVFLFGCRKKEQEVEETVSPDLEILEGIVFFQERMVLPDNGIVEVALEEESPFDDSIRVIASTQMATEDKSKWNFTLAYDAAEIQEFHRYVVRARIRFDDYLMFINEDGLAVLDGFTEGPLEVLVSKTSPYPKKDEDTVPDTSLRDTYWKLIAIDGRPPMMGNSDKEVHLLMESESGIVRGFAGCNSFHGPYSERNPAFLSFGQLMMTKMECPGRMTTEHLFTMMMDRANSYDIDGTILKIYDGNSKLLAEFEAVTE